MNFNTSFLARVADTTPRAELAEALQYWVEREGTDGGIVGDLVELATSDDFQDDGGAQFWDVINAYTREVLASRKSTKAQAGAIFLAVELHQAYAA